MSRGIGPNSPQRTVPERWGYPFWDVVRDMADQGLSRAQVAQAVGYRATGHFCKLLANNPEHDPFDSYGVPAAYVRETGESFRHALTRMHKAGYLLIEAAREIGYSSYQPLQYAMDVRGIDLVFKRREAVPKEKKEPRMKARTRQPVGGEHPWKRDTRISLERHKSMGR